MRSLSLSVSGQPSSSSNPSLSSGSIGHWSSLSRMPLSVTSPLSVSGQPSSSSRPSLFSGSFGHLSSSSRMPSLSLSGSGQPSSSSNRSKSSGSSGHLSTSSLRPSPSRSPMFGSKTIPIMPRRFGLAPLPGRRPRPAPSERNELRARYTLIPPSASSGWKFSWSPSGSVP